MLAPEKFDLGPAVRFDEPRWPGNGGAGEGGGGEPWCPSGLSPKWRDSLEDLSCKGAVLGECVADPPHLPGLVLASCSLGISCPGIWACSWHPYPGL